MLHARIAGLLAMLVVVVGAIAAPTSPVSDQVRLLTNALVMDGTTMPNPAPGFVESAINDFIVPTLPGSYTGVPVRTPEQIVGINRSISDGADGLEAAIYQQDKAHPGEQFVAFGYSQSTMITMIVKARLEERKRQGESVPNIVFVGIGGGDWPNGSITSRLDGLVVPVIDFTFGGAPPADPANQIPSIQIARQYDGFADTAQFVSNPLAVANSLLGALFVHGLYGQEVSLDPDSPRYVPGTRKVQDGKTTYYWIPTADLPLFDPLRIVGVPEALIDVVEPFTKVLVDAGYDRSVGFNKPTPAQLIPTIDPATLSVQLAGAALEGANNAAKLVGTELPGHARLAGQLAATESASAATIGAPYHDAVAEVNDSVNPILAFNKAEAPVAKSVNKVTNDLGIPAIANQVLDSTLFPVSAWAERNVLSPASGAKLGPIASIARQFLKGVAPKLDADTDKTSDTASTSEKASTPNKDNDDS
jgi:hypothetical protein